MLLKHFRLQKSAIPFKHIENIKRNGAVAVIIPYLCQINTGITVKEWGIGEKPPFIFEYLVPVSYLEVDVPSGIYQRIHLLKSLEHIIVAHIGQ